MPLVSFLRMIYSEVTGPSRREHALTQRRSEVGGCGLGASDCWAGLPSQLTSRPRLPPPWDEGRSRVHG